MGGPSRRKTEGDPCMSMMALSREGWRAAFPDLFVEGPIVTARAPGRLDVLGGVGDYSGSLVFELPLACSTHVALQPRSDGRFELRSAGFSEETGDTRAGFPVADFVGKNQAAADVRRIFEASGRERWAAYALGPILLAAHELDQSLDAGLSVAVQGDVPLGAGVSSSASLEVATLTAALGLWNAEMDGLEQAALCQVSENLIAGAPCGIMDQMVCLFGRAHHCLALLCQPADIIGHCAVPEGVSFFAIDSGVKRSVAGSHYTDARVATFMGHRIISWYASGNGKRPDPFGGAIANLAPEDYEERFRDLVPDTISGLDFVRCYGDTIDRVTRIDPDKVYRVRSAVEHPIYENRRTFQFYGLLTVAQTECTDRVLANAGERLYESHRSYGERLDLGAPETDLIVELVREHGVKAGLYGARTTGGGSGGAVVILARTESAAVIHEIAAEYQRRTGNRTRVLEGSSDGAFATGAVRL